jgi:hypothetical protein
LVHVLFIHPHRQLHPAHFSADTLSHGARRTAIAAFFTIKLKHTHHFIDAVGVGVGGIETKLVAGHLKNNPTSSNANRKAEDIEGGKKPIAPQLAKRDFEVVTEHSVEWLQDDDYDTQPKLQIQCLVCKLLVFKYLHNLAFNKNVRIWTVGL